MGRLEAALAGKSGGRNPPVLKNWGEDPWGGVKVLSNLRDSLVLSEMALGIASVGTYPLGVERREFESGASRLPAETQLRIPAGGPRQSERAGDKLRGSKGKQPRPPTKAPNATLSGKGSGIAVTAGMLA